MWNYEKQKSRSPEKLRKSHCVIKSVNSVPVSDEKFWGKIKKTTNKEEREGVLLSIEPSFKFILSVMTYRISTSIKTSNTKYKQNKKTCNENDNAQGMRHRRKSTTIIIATVLPHYNSTLFSAVCIYQTESNDTVYEHRFYCRTPYAWNAQTNQLEEKYKAQ